MMAGDEEEHAVLLANYFMYMKKTTWLIIGNFLYTSLLKKGTGYTKTQM